MYLTNDELDSLVQRRACPNAVATIEQRRATDLRSILSAVANELLQLRIVTGIDASRPGAKPHRGRK